MYNITHFGILFRTGLIANMTRLGNIFFINGPSSVLSFYGGYYEKKPESSIEYSDIRAAVSGIYKSLTHNLLT